MFERFASWSTRWSGSTRAFILAALSILLWFVLEAMRFVDLPLAADKIAALRLLLVGLVLIAVMALRPQGILGKREEMVIRG